MPQTFDHLELMKLKMNIELLIIIIFYLIILYFASLSFLRQELL